MSLSIKIKTKIICLIISKNKVISSLQNKNQLTQFIKVVNLVPKIYWGTIKNKDFQPSRMLN